MLVYRALPRSFYPVGNIELKFLIDDINEKLLDCYTISEVFKCGNVLKNELMRIERLYNKVIYQ